MMPKRADNIVSFPPEMVPAGYLAKRIAEGPVWEDARHVTEIWSVSGCISKNFTEYIPYWKHNDYWFFNSPREILEISREESLELNSFKLCYYAVYPSEFHERFRQWKSFMPFADFATDVQLPTAAMRLGYDVVTYSVGNSPECSPLTCSGLAGKLQANSKGLFDTFPAAKTALEAGAFDNSEPGPFRIIEVSTLPWPEGD